MNREHSHFFGPFRLDPDNAQLWRDDEEIVLRRKTFEVLRYLVEHPGQLITKDALLDAVWAGVTVGDTMPANCVVELRRALGDDPKSPKFIETVHRRGYRFVAPVTDETKRSAPALAEQSRALLVGRDEELEQLRRWYGQMRHARRQIIFVTGEAGIGKSAFLQRFTDVVTAEGGSRVGQGQCVEQYGAGEPYMPVLEALSHLGEESGGARVVDILERFAPMWLAQMPGLLSREERARLRDEIQGVTQQRMLREITDALEALTAEEPLLLTLEDLHWSDFSTLELISALARRQKPMRLMIVGTYRPVEILTQNHPLRTMKQELELHRYCEELRLKLLSEKNVASYLSERLSSDGGKEFATLTPLIYARTDGNPLFVVNVVDYLLGKDGLMMGAQEPHSPETLAGAFDPPRNLRQMIECNLERLSLEEQAILEGASVAGAEFSAASVAAALDREQNEIEECCMRLSRREQFISARDAITWPDGTVTAGFRFHHGLYQEVLYSRLPLGHQVQLHQRIAAREEAAYGERSAEIATELAHHYSLAHIHKKAIECFQIAAERAVARGAAVEAEEHYRSALRHLNGLPRTIEHDRLELALQTALGTVLWTAKSWSHPETARTFARAQELAETLGEDIQLLAVLFGLFLSATGSGRYRLAGDLAERMLKVAERTNSPASLSFAHTFLGETLLEEAKYREAQKHLELANSLCTVSELQGLNEWALAAPALLAINTLVLGYPGRARELAEKASNYAAGCADPHKIGGVHLWLGFFNGMLHDASRELENARVMHELAVKHPVWTGLANFFTACVKTIESDWEEAERRLADAIVFHEFVSLSGPLNWFNFERAKLLAHKGLLNDALALASHTADSRELIHLRVPALQLMAELLAQSSIDHSTIESAYHTAIDCARDQEARYYELEAITSFAKWLKTMGRSIEARTMLTEIYSWFEEGFDTPALQQAKALLDELAGEPRASVRSAKARK